MIIPTYQADWVYVVKFMFYVNSVLKYTFVRELCCYVHFDEVERASAVIDTYVLQDLILSVILINMIFPNLNFYENRLCQTLN